MSYYIRLQQTARSKVIALKQTNHLFRYEDYQPIEPFVQLLLVNFLKKLEQAAWLKQMTGIHNQDMGDAS